MRDKASYWHLSLLRTKAFFPIFTRIFCPRRPGKVSKIGPVSQKFKGSVLSCLVFVVCLFWLGHRCKGPAFWLSVLVSFAFKLQWFMLQKDVENHQTDRNYLINLDTPHCTAASKRNRKRKLKLQRAICSMNKQQRTSSESINRDYDSPLNHVKHAQVCFLSVMLVLFLTYIIFLACIAVQEFAKNLFTFKLQKNDLLYFLI